MTTDTDTDTTPVVEHTEPTLEDQAELELRDRLTHLEHWRIRTEKAIGLLLLGLAAAAASLLLLLHTIRKAAR